MIEKELKAEVFSAWLILMRSFWCLLSRALLAVAREAIYILALLHDGVRSQLCGTSSPSLWSACIIQVCHHDTPAAPCARTAPLARMPLICLYSYPRNGMDRLLRRRHSNSHPLHPPRRLYRSVWLHRRKYPISYCRHESVRVWQQHWIRAFLWPLLQDHSPRLVHRHAAFLPKRHQERRRQSHRFMSSRRGGLVFGYTE